MRLGSNQPRRLVYLIISILFCSQDILAANSTSAALTSDDANILKLPCNPDDATKSNGFRKCSVVLNESLADIKHRVRTQTLEFYSGCDVDTSDLKITDDQLITKIIQEGSAQVPYKLLKSCPNGKINAPVCNPFPSRWNSKPNEAELETYINPSTNEAKSCGEWTYMHVQYRVKRKFGFVVRVDTTVTPDQRGQKGFREDAYTNGSWIRALSCHHQQVENEIVGNKVLKLTEVSPGTEGICKVMAEDYKRALIGLENGIVNFQKTSSSQNQTLSKNLTGHANIDDIENCNDADKLKKSGDDLGSVRQSACYLKTARQGIETMFRQLAACESFFRAKLSYEKFIDKFFADSKYDNRKNEIKSACMNNKNVNGCYQNTYLNLFKNATGSLWPDSGVCK